MRKNKKRYPASFTVEATFVMAIVLWTMGFLIKEAYRLHDGVTGSMILQETIQNTRHNQSEESGPETFLSEGIARGNPRLWLGTYRLSVDEEVESLDGRAQAGNWGTEIRMKKYEPERYLRFFQALIGKRGDTDDRGS